MARSSHRYDNMSITEIFNSVKKNYGYTKKDILSFNRTQPLTTVRQVAVYLARQDGILYEDLGRIFKRHYSNCINSHRVIGDRISINDPQVVEVVKTIRDAA